MKEKDVKEKLLVKKDENGKRFLYISMGRFKTVIFNLGISVKGYQIILNEVKPY